MKHNSLPIRLPVLVLFLLALACSKDSGSGKEGSDDLPTGPDWYRNAVFYELNVRSFQDSNGDGIGDFVGLTSRLDYLKELGIDALWLMPITPTPFEDSGYDVADYVGINLDYGTMEEFDAFLDAAHQLGIRVLVDLVLNHTSDQHAWFQESRQDRDNAKADWYVWSDQKGREDIGCGPAMPIFGSDPWEWDPVREQYYFHRFYPGQPDLNFRNPEVVEATLDAVRFWLDKGVDGFRCDVIGYLYEAADACEGLPETHDYIRQLRATLEDYPDRAMVAEPTNWGETAQYYGNGSDEFHMVFNFMFGYFWGSPMAVGERTALETAFMNGQRTNPEGAQEAIVIGSHDVARAYDAAGGQLWRQWVVAAIQMTAPGTPFIYYGEELGLRPGREIVVDPRDYQRTPMLWSDGPGWGFTTGQPWIAFGAQPETTHVEAESAQPDSMLNYYRDLLAFRRGNAVWGTGEFESLEIDNRSIFAYRRWNGNEAYLVAHNLTDQPQSGSLEEWDHPVPAQPAWGEGNASATGGRLQITLPPERSVIYKLR